MDSTKIKTKHETVAGKYEIKHRIHPSGAYSTSAKINGKWVQLHNNIIGKPDSMQIVRLIHHFS